MPDQTYPTAPWFCQCSGTECHYPETCAKGKSLCGGCAHKKCSATCAGVKIVPPGFVNSPMPARVTAEAFANAVETETKREVLSILDEAAGLVNEGGDRNDAYDHPAENFAKIAAVWSLILKHEVTQRQVALMMIGMKVIRDSHRPRRDNLVDIAGYARTAERLEERPVISYYTRTEAPR